MAIAVSELTTGGTGVDGATVNTASFTTTANELVLAVMLNQVTSGVPETPTLSGYAEVASALNPASDLRLTVLRRVGTSESGVKTFDFNGITQHGFAWKVIQITGAETSGTNGSDAIVQSASGQNTTGTTLSLSLSSSLGSTSNREIAFFGAKTNNTFAIEAGWTEIGAEQGATSPAQTLGAAWLDSSTEDLTTVGTFGASAQKVGIILEIKALGAGGGTARVRGLSARLMGVGAM